MKISINSVVYSGAWGGSNQFVKSICSQLSLSGHKVVSNLNEPDIDLILMVHPNKYNKIRRYGINEIKPYLAIHTNTILVHRVNVSDEGKNSDYENNLILESNKYADYTIFISSFLQNLYIRHGYDKRKPNKVILNGADRNIFNPNGGVEWQPNDKLKIVTHHWSSNYNKGYDIYERLDQLLGIEPYKNYFEFTLIGNIPSGLKLNNSTVIKPLSNIELAYSIKQHHIYLTAARNEGAGMHHIEGMMCGLPVLYINSGALPEYCSPYGIEFNLINFEQKLLEVRNNFKELKSNVLKCTYSDVIMSNQYIDIFEELVKNKRLHPIRRANLFTIIRYYFILKGVLLVGDLRDLLRRIRNIFQRE